MNIYYDIHDIKEEPLEEAQYYIYVIENTPQGNLKIGRTGNIQQRARSLSGSNGGSNAIKRIAVSPPTYLYSIEKSLHNHYDWYRLNGEWFDGSKISFEDVVEYVDNIFNSSSFDRVNNIRKEIVEKAKLNKQKPQGYEKEDFKIEND